MSLLTFRKSQYQHQSYTEDEASHICRQIQFAIQTGRNADYPVNGEEKRVLQNIKTAV